MMIQPDLNTERERLVVLAMELTKLRGRAVSLATLSSAAKLSRPRIETFFPNEDALFDAVIEHWFAPDIAIMEEIVASELPVERKMYEFFARRFIREQARYREDREMYALYCELGMARYDRVRGYIDLADHYLAELVAQAQAEGYFEGLTIDSALSLINQMVSCYTSPQHLMMLDQRLSVEKLAQIIDTLFVGLSARNNTATGISQIRLS